MLFHLAGLLESFIYVNIIYALAATFRHQQSGGRGSRDRRSKIASAISGEMMPEFFQQLNAFLPFTGIQAMRRTGAGLYKNALLERYVPHLLQWYCPLICPVHQLVVAAGSP